MKYADAAVLYKEFKSADLLTKQQTEVNKVKKRNLNIDLIQYNNLINNINERKSDEKKINNEENKNEIINKTAVNNNDTAAITLLSSICNTVHDFLNLSSMQLRLFVHSDINQQKRSANTSSDLTILKQILNFNLKVISAVQSAALQEKTSVYNK